MVLYPDLYIENVLEIDADFLKKNQLKGLLLDVDNTLLYYDRTRLKGIEVWVKERKAEGTKLCILSNSDKKDKVQLLAEDLGIPFIYFAKKPLKSGFKRAQKILGLEACHIGVVGDQIFTDVLGANRMKMKSILTKPLEERDIFITKVKRPLEDFIIKSYLKKRGN